MKINLATGDISRDTEFESEAGIMSDFEGKGDFPVDNFTGHTGLESEAESISDCEVEGNFPVSNVDSNCMCAGSKYLFKQKHIKL